MNGRLALATHILGIIAFREHEQRGPMTSDELAESIGTNAVVIRRVLSQLKKAGLVDSRRGVGGGTVLARAPKQINLRQAYEAVNDESREVLGRQAGAGDACGLAPLIAEYLGEVCGSAEEAMLQRLAQITVEEMSQQLADRLRRRASLQGKTIDL